MKGWDLERRVGVAGFAAMALGVAAVSVWWAVRVLTFSTSDGEDDPGWYFVANTIATVVFTVVTLWFARVAWAYVRARGGSGGGVVGWASAVVVAGTLWLSIALPFIGLFAAIVYVPMGLAALGLAMLLVRSARWARGRLRGAGAPGR